MIRCLDQIPELYRPFITASIKARLRLPTGDVHRPVVIATTSNGSLLVFEKHNIKFAAELSLNDCETIIVYRCPQAEFIVVFSKKAGTCIAVDVVQRKISATWTGISDVFVDSESNPGTNLLVLTGSLTFSTKKLRFLSFWQNFLQTEKTSQSDGKSSVAENVKSGLERQLTMTCKHLNNVEEKNVQLKNELSQTLITFREEAKKAKISTLTQPSFTVPLGGSSRLVAPCVSSNEECPLKIDLQISRLWHKILDRDWIVGCSVYNNSERTLDSVSCCLTSSGSSSKLNYEVNYWKQEAVRDSGSVPLAKLRRTHEAVGNGSGNLTEWDGTLKPGQYCHIIASTEVPNFCEADFVEAFAFLSCSLGGNGKRLHWSLGKVRLEFREVLSSELQFKTNNLDTASFQNEQHLYLSLTSILSFQETVTISSLHSPANNVFAKSLQNLGLVPLYTYSLTNYYSLGKPFLVLLQASSSSSQKIDIKINATSKHDFFRFLRALLTELPDDCHILPSQSRQTKSLRNLIDSEISSFLSRLSSLTAGESEDVTLVPESIGEIEEAIPPLQNLREKFLRINENVKSLFAADSVLSGFINLSLSDYREIQNM